MDILRELCTRSEVGCSYVTGISSEVNNCGYVQLRNPRHGRGRGQNVSIALSPRLAYHDCCVCPADNVAS